MATGPIPRVTAMRYVQPLREGGSLPAVVDTEDGLYVVKFRGAGQGPKALVAELIVGLLAERLDLPVPQVALVDLPAPFGRSEPDPEIQDLLRGSQGINIGLRYLDGAFNFDPAAAGDVITPGFGARVVWLDALVTNPDRTHRNPNLLVWDRRPWLIDHGAALYVHHHWANATPEKTRGPFPLVANHVLLGWSDGLEEVDEEAAAAVEGRVLEEIVSALPDELLTGPQFEAEGDPDTQRRRYHGYLTERLRAPRAFATGAVEARERLRRTTPQRRAARR
ncbi:MAG TPA: HipA family kinase [Gemmatimonadales bacterium]|jgi:hypothetical protein